MLLSGTPSLNAKRGETHEKEQGVEREQSRKEGVEGRGEKARVGLNNGIELEG